MYNPFTFEAEHIETIHNHFHDSPNPIDWGTLHPALTNAAREIWSDPNCGVLDAAAIYIQYLVRSKAFGRQTGDTALVTGLLLMRLYGYGFVCTQQYLYNFVERAHITDRDTIALCLYGAYAGANSYVESTHLQRPFVPMEVDDNTLDEETTISLTDAIKMAYDVNGDYGACQKKKKLRLNPSRRWIRLADL